MMLTIAQESPLTEDSRALLAGSEAALRAAYAISDCSSFTAEDLAKDNIRFFVARSDGTPVGCVALCAYETYGEIKRLFARPDRRGEGIAKALMAHLETVALTDGVLCIRLETGSKLEAAVALYTALGYATRGPFADYKQTDTKVYMEKAL